MIDDWMMNELEGGRFCGWAKSVEDVILMLFLGLRKERNSKKFEDKFASLDSFWSLSSIQTLGGA